MSNMVINTNVLALNSHRNLKVVGEKQGKSSARLSSGFKINSAADDAAGLAISEKMRAQIRGLDMASKNTQDGVSLIQTAEGGMQEVDNMLQRIRELVDQASNDTNENNAVGTGDRQKIQDEINQLVAEIDSMAERVEFNNKKVINGTYADVAAQIRQTSAEFVVLSKTSASAVELRKSVSNLKTSIGARQSGLAMKAASMEAAIASGGLTNDKALLSGMTSAIKSLKTSIQFIQGCANNRETLMGKKATQALVCCAAYNRLCGLKKLSTKGTQTLHFQIGANANQSLQLNINSVKSDTLGIGTGNGVARFDLTKDSGVDTTGYLAVLDKALSYVTTERSKLGAAQNRLEYTQKSLDISSENLSASESRIRNADMAKEMMNMTQSNVLQQAATSMLAQANQAPQNILQLLG